MAAAIRHAAGGALLVGTSPAASFTFTWRAFAASAPRLLRLLQHPSSPRTLHTLRLHRPPAAAVARTTAPRLLLRRPAPLSVMGPRHFSSYERYKSLPEEEKMKRRKDLAVALMEPSPSTGDDQEIKSINNLFALLDLPPDNNAHNNADLEKQVRELRSLVEKKKKAMLIQLLDDNDKGGHGKEHRTEELVSAARQLRDALTQQRQNSSLHTLCTDLQMLKESVAASRIESESANALTVSLYTDLKRLEKSVTDGRIESELANALANSVCTDVERVKKSLAAGRSESEKAYGLSLFLCFASGGAAIWAIAYGMT